MDAVVPPTIISLAACGLFAFEEVSFGLRNQRSWDMLYIKLIKKRWSLGHEEWTKLDFVEGQTWVKKESMYCKFLGNVKAKGVFMLHTWSLNNNLYTWFDQPKG